MGSVLVAYASTHGQTETVAEYIATVLADRGHDVTMKRITTVPDKTVDDFDAVLVGSPVIDRAHLPAVVAFVERNREALATRPTAFFQLSFAAALPFEWARDGDRAWVSDLVSCTGWQPDRVGRFAGAVTYPEYDRVTRLVFKLVSLVTTGDTDTTRAYEYTDWNDVEAFATGFAAFVAQQEDLERVSTGTARGFAQPAATIAFLLGLSGLAYWLVVTRSAGDRSDRYESPTRALQPDHGPADQ